MINIHVHVPVYIVFVAGPGVWPLREIFHLNLCSGVNPFCFVFCCFFLGGGQNLEAYLTDSLIYSRSGIL